jgi:hypothetical protein
MHNRFEVLESVRMVGAQRTEGPKKKLIQELQ